MSDDFAARVGAGAPGGGPEDDDDDLDEAFASRDSRPEIEIRAGEMPRMVDEAEAALIAAQASAPVEKKVFRRGDRIVSIATAKRRTIAGRLSRRRSLWNSRNPLSPSASRLRRPS
jgi:hypothetical protein